MSGFIIESTIIRISIQSSNDYHLSRDFPEHMTIRAYRRDDSLALTIHGYPNTPMDVWYYEQGESSKTFPELEKLFQVGSPYHDQLY